jgi:hypothetical protein
MQFKFVVPLFACAIATQAMAARPIFNDGGLGCGTIVSLRESTQMPLPSELQDEYDGPRSSGGVVLQLLSYVPGIGRVAAVAGEMAASAAISTVSSSMQDAERARQAASMTYKNVMAVEFRFDDGLAVNIPVYVVSGMRYKVGARLNAMVSPKYGSVALGANILFAGIPAVGDSDYSVACRIDDAQARAAALEPLKGLVDEARIVNAKERRIAAAQIPKSDAIAATEAK